MSEQMLIDFVGIICMGLGIVFLILDHARRKETQNNPNLKYAKILKTEKVEEGYQITIEYQKNHKITNRLDIIDTKKPRKDHLLIDDDHGITIVEADKTYCISALIFFFVSMIILSGALDKLVM